MAKPIIKFKTYRQAAAVGGKIYGVPNLGDPVVAEVTMQEVIDYAKLHNYSADTLSALLSQVIAGVGDLVARDGRPRMLSDLLKFEPVIKGTFDNMEQTVRGQKVLVRPRMLKEIKVALDPSKYSWQNVNDKESPKIISAAPLSDSYAEFNLVSFSASLGRFDSGEEIFVDGFGWSLAGSRLCPNGFDSTCKFAVLARRGADEFHLENDFVESSGGLFVVDGDSTQTDNVLDIRFDPATGITKNAWKFSGEQRVGVSYVPAAGDVVVFQFTRTTASGDTFTVEKFYTL